MPFNPGDHYKGAPERIFESEAGTEIAWRVREAFFFKSLECSYLMLNLTDKQVFLAFGFIIYHVLGAAQAREADGDRGMILETNLYHTTIASSGDRDQLGLFTANTELREGQRYILGCCVIALGDWGRHFDLGHWHTEVWERSCQVYIYSGQS